MSRPSTSPTSWRARRLLAHTDIMKWREIRCFSPKHDGSARALLVAMRSYVKLRALFATAMGVTACGPSSVDHSQLTGDTCTGAPVYEPLAGLTSSTPF